METKKHILLYNMNEPLPQQGGMERVTDLLAKALLEVGYEVILLCRYKNRLGKEYHAPTDIFYLTDAKDERVFFCHLLEEYHIDCVIDQTEGGIVGQFGIFKDRNQLNDRVKLLAVQHNSTRAILDHYSLALFKPFEHSLWGNLKQWIYNKCLLKVRYVHSLWMTKRLYRELNVNYDRIITLSPNFIDDFCYYCPQADRKKLVAIPNFNTYEKTILSSHQKSVLFVGRLRNCVKGVDKLLRIWSLVESFCPDWQLDIVGDGEDRSNLEKQAMELGLKHVIFHGFQNPTNFYQHSRIFCMTSIYEGFGMVLTEAMQHGVVPMAFDSYRSVRDIIDDRVNGILVTPFDEKEYADQLMNLMRDETLFYEMANAARLKSDVFSKDNIIRKWQNALDVIL